MRHYFTAEEFNLFNAEYLSNKPMEDEHSRYIIETLILETLPYKKLTASKGNRYYDLMLTKLDKTKAALEIKFRYTDPYDTMIINDEKYQSFTKNLENGKIKEGHLFSIWKNGLIWVSNVFMDHETRNYYLNKTTNVSEKTDGVKTDKLCHCYKPQTIWYFVYFYDYEEGRWEPIFSREPIDIKKLEDKYNTVESVTLF